MEVNLSNFVELKPKILQQISNATFISMDLEFTGLRDPDAPEVVPFDTVETAYLIKSASVTQFAAIQLGLSIFHYNPTEDHYDYAAYNIYMFPREPQLSQNLLQKLSQKAFLSEFSSLQFLGSFDFDFNKWIKQGVGFMRPSDREYLVKELTSRSEFRCKETLERRTKANGNGPAIPDEMKPEINEHLKLVKEFVDSNESGNRLILTPSNRRLKGYLKDAIAFGFRTQVVVDIKVVDQQDSTVLVEKCASEEELKSKFQAILDSEIAIVDSAYGLTSIIDAISSSKCLLVGHYTILDVLHLFKSFHSALPPTYAEFKSQMADFLPNMVDTKVLVSQSPLKELIKGGDGLQELFETCKTIPKPKLIPTEPQFGYAIGSTRDHEAGYDAFATGVVFLTLTNYCADKKNPGRKTTQLSMEVLEPFLNKIPVPRGSDCLTFNLSGPETSVGSSRSHIFHLQIHRNWWTRTDVANLFSGFGPVKQKWIDNYSLFVELTRVDQAASVMKQMKEVGSGDYTVTPCVEFSEKRQKSLKIAYGVKPGRVQMEGNEILGKRAAGQRGKTGEIRNGKAAKIQETFAMDTEWP